MNILINLCVKLDYACRLQLMILHPRRIYYILLLLGLLSFGQKMFEFRITTVIFSLIINYITHLLNLL